MDENCVAVVEKQLADARVSVNKDKRVTFGGSPPDMFRTGTATAQCLQSFRPDFWHIVSSDAPGTLKDHLGQAAAQNLLQAQADSNGLRIVSPAKTTPLPANNCTGDSGCPPTATEPPVQAQNPPIQREAAHADNPGPARLDAIPERLDKLTKTVVSMSGAGASVYAVLLLLAAILVLQIAQISRRGEGGSSGFSRFVNSSGAYRGSAHAGARGQQMPETPEATLNWIASTTDQLMKAVRALEVKAAEQVSATEELRRQLDLRVAGISDLTAGERGWAAQQTEATPYAETQQAISRPVSDDPITWYRALAENRFLPNAERMDVQDRWRARSYIQIADAGEWFHRPADGDGNALMWILLDAKQGDRYPVILSPAAYDARWAENNGRPLETDTSAFFRASQKRGDRAILVAPAWVRRCASRDEITLEKKGEISL